MMRKLGLSINKLMSLAMLLALSSLEVSAQLKSDLILQPAVKVQKATSILSDSRGLTNPLLFKNNTYLMPTAFFCKMELGLDKKSFMPIRFRLGSVDYVNYLEGKDKSGTIDLSGEY